MTILVFIHVSTRGKLQITLQRFEFAPADLAKFPQGVISRGCAGLNFLGCKVRLRIGAKDRFSDAFRTLYDFRWGAQTHGADERVNWCDRAGVFQCVLHSVDHGTRARTDEISNTAARDEQLS